MKFFVPDKQPPAAWNTLEFNDAGLSTGPSCFGYGDGDDVTEFPPIILVFMRKIFPVTGLNSISRAFLKIDYDDAFITYLNGEVHRDGIS